MPATDSNFNDHTNGTAVVDQYADQVKGKIVLITGANPGGIGGLTAIALARASPELLIIAGRNESKLAETAAKIREVDSAIEIKPLILDLSSQASCKKAAQEILDDLSVPHIDLLINNAGVMNIEKRTLSPEGIEMQFATNHIGHFLFTNLILPKVIAASDKTSSKGTTRIINLSSRAVMYSPVRFSDWNFTKPQSELPESEHMSDQVRTMWDQREDKPYIPQAAYGQSKSANVLFSLELNRRLYDQHGILSVAVHPGGVSTELGRHIPSETMDKVLKSFKANSPNFHMKDLDQGSSTTLVAALDPKITQGDLFMSDCQVADWAPEWSTDPELAVKLWKLSEEIVGQEFAA